MNPLLGILASRRRNTGPIPALDLNFALGSFAAALGPLPTYSRASAATYFGSDGVLATATTNTPRIDYDPVTLQCRGLLLEPAATNSAINSNTFSGWTSANVTLGTGSAFLNGSDFKVLTAQAGSGSHWLFCGVPNGLKAVSVFAKAGTVSWLGLGCGAGSSSRGAFFDLTNGVVGAVNGVGYGAYIEDWGGGIFRCVVLCPSGDEFISIEIHDADNQALSWNAAGTETLEIIGAQSEAGIFATSLINTTGSSVTRAADVCSISGSDFTGFYNQSAGSFVVDAEQIGGQSGVFIASDTTYDGNNRIDMRFPNVALVTNATVNVATLNYGTGRRKYLSYAANDFASGSDGVAGTSDASGSPPATLTKLVLGCLEGGGNQSAMLLRRFRYFPIRLTEEQLLALTAP